MSVISWLPKTQKRKILQVSKLTFRPSAGFKINVQTFEVVLYIFRVWCVQAIYHGKIPLKSFEWYIICKFFNIEWRRYGCQSWLLENIISFFYKNSWQIQMKKESTHQILYIILKDFTWAFFLIAYMCIFGARYWLKKNFNFTNGDFFLNY